MRIDRPEHYYFVSLERIKQAWFLYEKPDHENYALAMYVAGVAVESMLRALKMFRDPVFDEKHDLFRLFKASRLLEPDTDLLGVRGFSPSQVETYLRELEAAASEVCRLWSNNYRFASGERLRAHLKSEKLDRKIKGDFLKKRALDLLKASQTVIEKGVLQWNSLKRSNRS